MFSYYWCQTYHICPRFRKPDRIRIHCSKGLQGTSDTKSIQTKKKAFKIIQNIYSIDYKNLPSFEIQYRALDPVFVHSRIFILVLQRADAPTSGSSGPPSTWGARSSPSTSTGCGMAAISNQRQADHLTSVFHYEAYPSWYIKCTCIMIYIPLAINDMAVDFLKFIS